MKTLNWSKLGHLFLTGIPLKTLWAATYFYRRKPDENVLPSSPINVPKPAISTLKKVTLDAGAMNNVDWSQTIALKHDDA
jgi:hypothetical protein